MEIEFRALIKSTLDFNQVDWGSSEEGTDFPAVILFPVGEFPDHDFSGATPLRKSIVQVQIWSDDFAECIALKNKMYAIDGYKGGAVSNINAIQIQEITSQRVNGANFSTHLYAIDCHIWHYR